MVRIPKLSARSIAATVLVSALLVGCALTGDNAESTKTEKPQQTESPEPEVTEPATPVARGPIAVPLTCTELVGPELIATFAAEGNVLLSGDDGSGSWSVGTISSIQETGTPFSCWFGAAAYDPSDFEVAVQPLTEEGYASTRAALEAGNFVVSGSDVLTFSQEGVYGSTSAIVHELHPDGWITIGRVAGGPESLADIEAWMPIVSARLYAGG